MKQTVADALIETIHNWGVEVIFGLPGDGINGLMEALRTRKDKIRFIQVRHEEAAAFMACGYAKYTGKLGVCLATSGPGGIHLLNGLYDAKLDGQPVLAITGMHFHDLLGTYAQQDVELDKLFQDVAVYNTRVMGPAHVVNIAELACRKAITTPGVAHITIPVDTQSMEFSQEFASQRNVPFHTSAEWGRPTPLPLERDLRRAAALLNSGKKVTILAGRGALGATDELLELAEKLGAPIAKALLGKAAVPDESVYTTGSIGLLGTRPSQTAMEECDTLLMVGTSFPYIEYLPTPGQAKGIQIDRDPGRIGLRYPVEVGLVGETKATLQALLPLLENKSDKSFLLKAQRGMEDWWQLMRERGTNQSKPMSPQVVAWELGKLLADDAIVSCDSGTVATWWARQIPAKRNQKYSLSGNLATMACGLSYAIAAAIAFPQRQSIAFVGDGGFSMLMAEFVTCVKYQLPVKVIVIKNNTLGQIKWEQMVFLGNPEFGCDLEPIDFAAIARACGGKAYTIEDPADCGGILQQALSEPGPVLVEAIVNPHEPPLPGKIDADQAAKFAKSLAKGTPNKEKIALTILKNRIKEMI